MENPTPPMHAPARPFAEVAGSLKSHAYGRVSAMSEDQLRYAMWAVLVNVAGCPRSNMHEVLAGNEALTLESTEASLILQQLLFKPGSPVIADSLGRLDQMSRSITCPKCGRTSHNPNDVANRYCGACHQFHADPVGDPAGAPPGSF